MHCPNEDAYLDYFIIVELLLQRNVSRGGTKGKLTSGTGHIMPNQQFITG